jgi:hypothetical protein
MITIRFSTRLLCSNQGALVNELQMIIIQIGTQIYQRMAAVSETLCAVPPRNSNQ